jgi:hypothetical protein
MILSLFKVEEMRSLQRRNERVILYGLTTKKTIIGGRPTI